MQELGLMKGFHVYTAVKSSDREVLARDLTSSPDIRSGAVPLTTLWDNNTSIPVRYARAMEKAEADILIFCHSDIYFPAGWFNRLDKEISRLEKMDPNWAVASISGMTKEGVHIGRLWDTGLGRVIGGSSDQIAPIASMDEMTFIVRRDSGVRFDEKIPTDIHLFATDLVLSARRMGLGAYGIVLPVIHNSKPVERIAPEFVTAYRYLVDKWRSELPIPTVSYITLSTNPWPLWQKRLAMRYKAIFRSSTFVSDRLVDPRTKSIELGYEQG